METDITGQVQAVEVALQAIQAQMALVTADVAKKQQFLASAQAAVDAVKA